MIFVTIGTQEPFDRLIKSIIKIAKVTDEQFIVQTPTYMSETKNVQFVDFLSPEEYLAVFKKSKLVIKEEYDKRSKRLKIKESLIRLLAPIL